MAKKKESLKPDKVKFYHRHTTDGLPRVTVCLAELNGIVARGISLCSFSEKVCRKKYGKFLARNRAFRALLGRSSSSDFISRDEGDKVIADAGVWFSKKSELSPDLSTYEKKLLEA